MQEILKGEAQAISYGQVVNDKCDHRYTLACNMADISWNNVVIVDGPVDCDPEQLSSARA